MVSRVPFQHYNWSEATIAKFPDCYKCEHCIECEVIDPQASCPYRKKRGKCCKFPEGEA